MSDADHQRLGRLQGLVNHPAWAEYAHQGELACSSAHAKALGAVATPDERAEHAAAYRALRHLIDWPQDEINKLTAKLQGGNDG